MSNQSKHLEALDQWSAEAFALKLLVINAPVFSHHSLLRGAQKPIDGVGQDCVGLFSLLFVSD